MRINNRKKKDWLVLFVIVMLVGVFSAAFSIGTVYAESDGIPTSTPTPSANPTGVFPGIILEKTHNFQIKIIELLGNQLNKANKIESKAQFRITELKQQGKDVTALEDALNKFYSFIATAKQAKDNASATLILHKGYDIQGKITDPKLARETNKSVEERIRICRENVVQALKTIASGLKIFKQQNSPQPANM